MGQVLGCVLRQAVVAKKISQTNFRVILIERWKRDIILASYSTSRAGPHSVKTTSRDLAQPSSSSERKARHTSPYVEKKPTHA